MVSAARTARNKINVAAYIGKGIITPGAGGGVVPSLGPSSAAFTAGAASGSLITAVTGLQSGETLASVTPNDGRLAVSGGALLVGLSAATAGTINATITTSAGRSLAVAVTVAVPAGSYFTDTPIALYGTARLMPAANYNGPVLHVVRKSDGALMDVGFSGDLLDRDAALAFQGSSELEIDVAYDLTGGGKHATFAAGARPVLWLGNGGPTITNFDAAPMTLPASVAVDRRDVSVFMVCRRIAQSRGANFWELGASGDFGLRNYSSAYANQPYADGVLVAPVSAPADGAHVGIANMSIVATVSTASGIVQHRDEKTLAFPAVSSKALTGGRVGTGALVATTKLDIACFALFTGLAAANVSAAKAVLKQAFKTAPAATRVIIEDGDSQTEGTGAIHNRTPAAALDYRLGNVGTIIRNIGFAGTTMAAQKNKWTNASRRFSHDGVPVVLRSALGRNDIASIGTPTQTDVDTLIADAKTYYTAVRANNVADHIIGVCQPPSAIGRAPNTASPTGFWNQAQDDAQAAYVAWIKSNPVDTNGLKIFNAIENLWDHPVIGHGPTTDGTGLHDAFDRALFSDGIHQSEFVNDTYLSVTQANALNAIVPNPLSISAAPVTVANQNTAYAGFTPTVRYGTAPYTFSLAPSSGALPAGMTLNTSTGSPQGTPTSVETKTGIIIRVTDAAGATADLPAFQIAVSSPQSVVVQSVTESFLTSDGTAFPITLPATINAGDLLVVPVAIDSNATLAWDDATAGTWTLAFNDAQTANRLLVYTKVADGTEDGKVLNTTISNAQQIAAKVFRLTGAQGAVAVSATGFRGTSVNPDPGVVTAPWGVANNLFLVAASLDNVASITAGPSGYGNLDTRITSASGQIGLATTYKSASSASDDPNVFTSSTSIGYVCATIAVRPS